MTTTPITDSCPNCGASSFSLDRAPVGVINVRYCGGCGWPCISDVWAEQKRTRLLAREP